MFSKDLLSLIGPLGTADSSQSVKHQADKIAFDLGFDYCSSVSRSFGDLCDPNIKVFHNYPVEWEALYKERSYFASDPANGAQALEVPLYRWHTEPTSEVMQTARDFSITSGVTCSVRGRRDICSISFASRRLELTEDMLVGAQFISSFIVNALVRTREEEGKDEQTHEVKLSARETECLRWVALGKTSWEVSVILSISERTVLFHLSNIQSKLGTCSRPHSVARAAMLGLLDVDLSSCDPFELSDA